jgi:hypothetical protein
VTPETLVMLALFSLCALALRLWHTRFGAALAYLALLWPYAVVTAELVGRAVP